MSFSEAHTHQLEGSSYLPPFAKAGHAMSNNEQAKEVRSTVTRFSAHSLCRKVGRGRGHGGSGGCRPNDLL
jgi:hypothetical protein